MTQEAKRRYRSVAEKKKLIAEARRRRGLGESWLEIAEALKVPHSCLYAWMRKWPEQGLLRRVEIVDAPVSTTGLALVSPDGFRFENLDIESVAALWRRLR